MKKILVSIAIISASIFSTFAATDTKTSTDSQTRTECTTDGGKQHKGKHGKQNRGMKAFEGITLTDSQKSQLEALRAEKQQKREQAQRQFEAKVKEILTPEQYAKFLDNTKEMASHKGNKDMKKDGKRQKNGKDKKNRQNAGKNRNGNSRQG